MIEDKTVKYQNALVIEQKTISWLVDNTDLQASDIQHISTEIKYNLYDFVLFDDIKADVVCALTPLEGELMRIKKRKINHFHLNENITWLFDVYPTAPFSMENTKDVLKMQVGDIKLIHLPSLYNQYTAELSCKDELAKIKRVFKYNSLPDNVYDQLVDFSSTVEYNFRETDEYLYFPKTSPFVYNTITKDLLKRDDLLKDTKGT